MKHARPSIIATGLLALSLGAAAILGAVPSLKADDTHHTVVAGDTVKWGPAPPSLPPGAQAAVLFGNPGKEGFFSLRLKFPPGFVIPPHRHSNDELVTVIAGRVGITAGEKIDRASVQFLPTASFVHIPAGMAHYASADGEAIVQIIGMGPFTVTYVDPKDDPRL